MPWSLTFDLRERETLWTDENKERLLRLAASYELGIGQEETQLRLMTLLVLLPGLAMRLPRMSSGGSRVSVLSPHTD